MEADGKCSFIEPPEVFTSTQPRLASTLVTVPSIVCRASAPSGVVAGAAAWATPPTSTTARSIGIGSALFMLSSIDDLQQTLDRDWQIPHTLAGGVVDRVGD